MRCQLIVAFPFLFVCFLFYFNNISWHNFAFQLCYNWVDNSMGINKWKALLSLQIYGKKCLRSMQPNLLTAYKQMHILSYKTSTNFKGQAKADVKVCRISCTFIVPPDTAGVLTFILGLCRGHWTGEEASFRSSSPTLNPHVSYLLLGRVLQVLSEQGFVYIVKLMSWQAPGDPRAFLHPEQYAGHAGTLEGLGKQDLVELPVSH